MITKKFLISFLLLFVLIVYSSKAEETADTYETNEKILDLYNNILIGEIFRSGIVYLEYFHINRYEALSENLNALKHIRKLKVYPVRDTSYKYFKASFKKIVKGEYIPDLEENSRYFS